MQAIRHLLAERHLAILICLVTLLLRLLIPTGYMIDSDRGYLAVTLCSGTGPATMPMDMPGMHADAAAYGAGHEHSDEHGKAEAPCAFAGLSAAVVTPIDPVQLAALIAFVLAIGLACVPLPAASGPTRLRPPLRAPPLHL